VHSRLDRPIAAFVELAHRRLDLDHRLLHGGKAQQLVAPTSSMGRRWDGEYQVARDTAWHQRKSTLRPDTRLGEHVCATALGRVKGFRKALGRAQAGRADEVCFSCYSYPIRCDLSSVVCCMLSVGCMDERTLRSLTPIWGPSSSSAVAEAKRVNGARACVSVYFPCAVIPKHAFAQQSWRAVAHHSRGLHKQRNASVRLRA
jgi:hypothetical protein